MITTIDDILRDAFDLRIGVSEAAGGAWLRVGVSDGWIDSGPYRGRAGAGVSKRRRVTALERGGGNDRSLGVGGECRPPEWYRAGGALLLLLSWRLLRTNTRPRRRSRSSSVSFFSCGGVVSPRWVGGMVLVDLGVPFRGAAVGC